MIPTREGSADGCVHVSTVRRVLAVRRVEENRIHRRRARDGAGPDQGPPQTWRDRRGAIWFRGSRETEQEKDDGVAPDGAEREIIASDHATPYGSYEDSTPAAGVPALGSPVPLSHRYVDLGQIGEGGMSTVRRIRDLSLMREVALKRLDPELNFEEDRVLRFLEEAQITGQLDHPNIVPIHELGEDEDGAFYFSMKLVEGRNLEEEIEDAGAERLAPERLVEFLEILVRVCEAVSFAHSRGVIHRYLKPANVMVGDYGQVYVMDWGSPASWAVATAAVTATTAARTAKTRSRCRRRPTTGSSILPG